MNSYLVEYAQIEKYRNVIMCIYLDQYIVTCFLGLSAEEIRVVTLQ